MLLYPINAMLTNPSRAGGMELGPKLQDWMKRVEARPAYQRGLERLKKEEKLAEEGQKSG